MTTFKQDGGNWVRFRDFDKLMEVDFHWAEEKSSSSYWENMDAVWNRALSALKKAQVEGVQYVLFTHGHSTSHMGKITSRSQVRKLMRSPIATPYLLRNQCIQHSSVFLAAVRPLEPKSAELTV